MILVRKKTIFQCQQIVLKLMFFCRFLQWTRVVDKSNDETKKHVVKQTKKHAHKIERAVSTFQLLSAWYCISSFSFFFRGEIFNQLFNRKKQPHHLIKSSVSLNGIQVEIRQQIETADQNFPVNWKHILRGFVFSLEILMMTTMI